MDLVSTLCPAGSGFVDLTHAHSCVCPAFPFLFFYLFFFFLKHLPCGKVSRTACLPAQRLTAVKAESLKALQCDGLGGVLVVGFYECVPINWSGVRNSENTKAEAGSQTGFLKKNLQFI